MPRLEPAADEDRPLPPGQRRIDGFPRFGAGLKQPPPKAPADPVIKIGGLVETSITFRVAELADLPRREIIADFHCVAGWTATDLRWEGVEFASFYREIIEPQLPADAMVTDFAFEGADGWRSIATAQDVLDDDVLIADTLDGKRLCRDHGAPVRLVSPRQYGFVSTKHLCRIDVYSKAPPERWHPSKLVRFGLAIVKPHRRARVWEEERHRYLPARAYRALTVVVVPVFQAIVSRIGHPTRPDHSGQ